MSNFQCYVCLICIAQFILIYINILCCFHLNNIFIIKLFYVVNIKVILLNKIN